MDWPRVKTLLICLFIAVNAALGGVWLWRAADAAARERLADADLRRLLEARGVDAGQTPIPGRTALRYDLVRDEDAERAMAEAVLGDIVLVEGSYSRYEGPGGWADFRLAGRFEIVPAVPADMGGGIDGIARAMGMAVAGGALSGGELTMTVEGLPVWNRSAVFTVEGDGLVSVSGAWPTGRPLPVSAEPCYSAGYCLLSLADRLQGGGRVELLSCSLGFMAESVSPETERLVPHWRFEMSDGIHYVNAYTGKP